MRLQVVLALAMSAGPCALADPSPAEPLLLNPFGDPFTQATAGSDCPAPLGPAYTEATRRQEAHSRIERGTSCWLAGECTEPNAYRFDARIAQVAITALRSDPSLAGTALWVTAQRRFIYLEGCVATEAQASRAEALAKAVADVQYVLPMLSLPGEKAAYRLARPASQPTASPQTPRTTPRSPRSPSHPT